MAATYTNMPFQQPLPLRQHHAEHQAQHSPAIQGNYMPNSYRHQLPRIDSTSGPGPFAGRYQAAPQYPPPASSICFPSAPLLPQPNQQMLHHQQHYPAIPTTSQGYQPPIAPTPFRHDYTSLSPSSIAQRVHHQPSLWTGADSEPSGAAGAARERLQAGAVDAPGSKDVLSAAYGQPARGSRAIAKSAPPPTKNEYGKYQCPHCPKSYLHRKHLKRHIYRHTGRRPYMCIICKDLFSRSDILKRHFYKCALHHGNPTGATHLSDPRSRVENHQEGGPKDL